MIKNSYFKYIFPISIFSLAVFLWLSLFFSLLGFFYAPLILVIGIFAVFNIWIYVSPSHGFYFSREDMKSKNSILVAALIIVVFAISSVAFFHCSFFDTRDEGYYSNNAVYLAKNHELPSEIGPQKTRLILNTSWNAFLYGLFGLRGILISNAIPMVLALFSIFFLVKGLSRNPYAPVFSIALITMCYPVIWYSRRTSNEMLFFSLLWISLYFIYRCIKRPKTFKTDFILLCLIFPLPAFIRPEGLLFPLLGIIILPLIVFFSKQNNKKRILCYSINSILFLCLSAFFAVFVMDSIYNLSSMFRTTVGLNSASGSEWVASQITPNSLRNNNFYYSFTAFVKMGLGPPLLLLIPFFLLLLTDRKNRLYGLILIFIVMPFAYFLFEPNIYFDLPWFLRRFVAVLVPATLIAFTYVVFKLQRVQAFIICSCCLLVITLVSMPILFHREYGGLYARTYEIASLLPDDELILVDRYALGEYGIAASLFLIYDKNTFRIHIHKKTSYESLQPHAKAYLVVNEEDFYGSTGNGRNYFDETVFITGSKVIASLDVEYPYLYPECQFHRGGNDATWKFMDYRISLSQLEMPSRTEKREYTLLIVELDLEYNPPLEEDDAS